MADYGVDVDTGDAIQVTLTCARTLFYRGYRAL
jgi:hypothetical protein